MSEINFENSSEKLTMEQKLELWLKAKRNAIKASTTEDRITSSANKGSSATKTAIHRSSSDPFKRSIGSADSQTHQSFNDSFGSPMSDDSKENTPQSENVTGTAPTTNNTAEGKSPKALFRSPKSSTNYSVTKVADRQSVGGGGGNSFSFRDRLENALQTQQRKSSLPSSAKPLKYLDIEEDEDTYFSPLSVSRFGTMKVSKSKTQQQSMVENSLASRESIARVGNRLSEKTGAEIAAKISQPAVGSLSGTMVSAGSVSTSFSDTGSSTTTNSNSSTTSDALRKALQDLDELSAKLIDAELRDTDLRSQLKVLKESEVEANSRAQMALEEVQAMQFLNSVQEMKINELEQAISLSRLESNEANSGRSRKHRAEVRRLTIEKSQYEERANQMVVQMTEQMTMLQETAMNRIEALEEELMEERRRSDTLQSEVSNLRTAAIISASRGGATTASSNANSRKTVNQQNDDDEEEEEEEEEVEEEEEEEEEDDEDGNETE